ncbi:hypothetical protein SDC9_205698 [bioreactor metagenome]|uniref:Uncharacterized protein n=1 Tax=bioreactor metagenome TaxID=1076179 RepID=A0A645J4F2_9ZZZZ
MRRTGITHGQFRHEKREKFFRTCPGIAGDATGPESLKKSFRQRPFEREPAVMESGYGRRIIMKTAGIVKTDFTRLQGERAFRITETAGAFHAPEKFDKVAKPDFLLAGRINPEMSGRPDPERNPFGFRINLSENRVLKKFHSYPSTEC